MPVKNGLSFLLPVSKFQVMKPSPTPQFPRPLCFFAAALILMLSPLAADRAAAKTSIDTTGLIGGVTLDDSASWAQNFETAVDDNGPAYANAFSFASTLGYTIGKANIGTFPSFEFGFSFSAGLTNMRNFQKSNSGVYNGTVPGIGLSPCLHFGIGLANGIDFVGKFMTFNQDIYEIPIPKNGYFNLNEFAVYSLGGKVRYNYVKDKTIIPFLLNFGGVTFSVGGDMMRGKYGVNGSYTRNLGTQTINAGLSVSPDFDGDFQANIAWYQLSSSFQAVAYFDIMYLFSVYSGFGVSLGYGWYSFDFDATGKVSDSSFGNMGTVVFASSNKYNPDVFLPTYILGLEMNIGFVKVVAESQVNLKNRQDVSASFGVRAQF